MPTTGSDVWPNSVVRGRIQVPARFHAASMRAICMPRQIPKKGISLLAGELYTRDLPSLRALAKSAPKRGIRETAPSSAEAVGFGMLEQLGDDPFDNLGAVGDPAMNQGFSEALIGVGKADIFADDPDRDLIS